MRHDCCAGVLAARPACAPPACTPPQEFSLCDLPELPLSRLLLQRLLRVHIRYVSTWLECLLLSELPVLYRDRLLVTASPGSVAVCSNDSLPHKYF